jgi:hypothetical protein
VNKNKVDGNAYISIGDSYKDPLPNTFRQPKKGEKAPNPMKMTLVPHNAENGNFGKVTYAPAKYQEVNLYLETQPLKSRKSGFGSGDAFKTDEFSNAIRTAQHRATIEKEKIYFQKSPEELEEELDRLQTIQESRPKSQFNKMERTSFDVMQAANEYNPKARSDTFYKFNDTKGRFYGPYKPSLADYGDGECSACPFLIHVNVMNSLPFYCHDSSFAFNFASW